MDTMAPVADPHGFSEVHPDAVILARTDTKEIVETNPAANELFGYSSAEFSSMNILDLHPSEDREAYRALFEAHLEEEPAVISYFEDGSPVYVVTTDGERIPVEIYAWTLDPEAHESDAPLVKGTFRDISARIAYERQLTQQRDNLDILNQILRHDIRNNLQMVTAYAELLDKHVDEDAIEYLARIQASARNAVELTETAREMADTMLSTDENYSPISLRSTLDSQLDEIRSEYSDAVITVQGAIPETTVVADEMLSSVFRNLLTNAVRHNDKEVVKVQVSVTHDDESVTVRIKDNGPGVPENQTEEIFGKGEMGLESPGTGLGLYLVDTLVTGYGGDVWVQNNEVRGATFVVKLPLAESHEPLREENRF